MLTIEEAREVLRLDSTDNDIIIMPLLKAIPSYIETTTGYTATIPVEPLAKTTASFILQLWYYEHNKETEQLKRTIDSLLGVLTIKARTL